MKPFVVVNFPDGQAYVGPNNKTKMNRLPCGTLLQVIGQVKGLDGFIYYVAEYSDKPVFVQTGQIIAVEPV